MLAQLFTYLSKADIDWAVCGGAAINMFIGRQTRDHKDVDVAVFWDQRKRLVACLLRGGWRLFEPERGLLREISCLNDDFICNDALWCITKTSAAYKIEREYGDYYGITALRKHQDVLDFMELLFNRRDGNRLVYKRNAGISHDGAILHDSAAIPYLAPEVVLLYQSVFTRYAGSDLPSEVETVKNCRHDFEAAAPLLDARQRHWLAEALQTAYPDGHVWSMLL